MSNLSAIVWLYRGQQKRFLALVKRYLRRVRRESNAVVTALAQFNQTLMDIVSWFDLLLKPGVPWTAVDLEKRQALADTVNELRESMVLYENDKIGVLTGLHNFDRRYAEDIPEENKAQHVARKAFEPNAEGCRGLLKQVDLLYRFAARAAELAATFATLNGAASHDRRVILKLVKQLDENRKIAMEQLKLPVYFHRQVAWLQERFPDAKLTPVPGLVKLVDRKEIEAADWSLTPGRYVGVAAREEEEDFDFEQTLRDIHTELADLNKEALNLANKIEGIFEELGA
jgi:type I restriction enzyme M protein